MRWSINRTNLHANQNTIQYTIAKEKDSLTSKLIKNTKAPQQEEEKAPTTTTDHHENRMKKKRQGEKRKKQFV